MAIASPVESQVARLLSEYVHCIDDERYEEWPDFFNDPCTYRITTRLAHERGYSAGLVECDSQGMLRDRINSMRHANIYEPHVYRHLLGPTRVVHSIDGRVRVRTGFSVMRIVQGQDAELFVTGVYDDVLADEGSGLKFSERIVVVDASRIDTLLVIPL